MSPSLTYNSGNTENNDLNIIDLVCNYNWPTLHDPMDSWNPAFKNIVYISTVLSPIFESDGSFLDIFNAVQEITQKFLNTRRLKILDAKSLESAYEIMKNILRDNDNVDILYALIYFVKHKLDHNVSGSLIARLISTSFDEYIKYKRLFLNYFPETHKLIDCIELKMLMLLIHSLNDSWHFIS
ncbi:protein-histidine kinase [Gigaspora margarita]|uniref:Protein-histidine kinase n=1 Tax=Gigaspora margarita TaxID=4874 RepID=A0A8H4AHC2_GIGMA|nr:protein-histidine kinase [Gigaspora margarita]